MEPTNAVANMVRERSCKHGQTNISTANVHALSDDVSQSTDANDKPQTTTAALPPWKTSHKIGTLQLLAAIKDAMCSDEPRLCFTT
jgi:hypothetical protein